jgi:uncharacterized protein involved in type VI secretion and phage assembly
MSSGPFLGKYRATVHDNFDPNGLGRIRAIVPAVTGPDHPSSWALPCLPAAGSNMGLFTVPQIGAGVWIEYEGGDPDYPIWVGGYWTQQADVPKLVPAAAPPVAAITLQTPNRNGVVISDAPGEGILIQGAGGAKISITNQGITIDNGQNAVITLNHNTVSLNGDALTVT